jgi:hypothetical protein
MGRMGEDRSSEAAARRQRVTVAQASEILGVTVEAVRGRIKRGTLDHERHFGTVYVLLDADQTSTGLQPDDDQTTDRLRSESDALTSELRDRLRYVEEQLEAERETHAESRRLLLAALEKIPPAIEAPREARESPVSPGPSDTPTSAPGEAHGEAEGTQRPWWRRILGG